MARLLNRIILNMVIIIIRKKENSASIGPFGTHNLKNSTQS